MKFNIIKGNFFSDYRGSISFNNDFDATQVKRIYVIENVRTDFIRAWQGHKIEQRWFTAIQGKFIIKLIEVDDWDNPSKELKSSSFKLGTDELDVLHIPAGYITSIQALEDTSKLLVMADFRINEIQDQYKYPVDYFNKQDYE